MNKNYNIELFNDQCSVPELWEFVEENLKINGFPYPMYWTNVKSIRNAMKKKGIYVAVINGKIVGCLITGGNYIEILCVRKRYRKRGIGTALVNHVESSWKLNKRRRLMQVESLGKFNARKFYEKMGFKVFKSRVYDNTWHLKKEMERQMSTTPSLKA